MLLSTLLFLLGIALLVKGGSWFVDGAVEIAEHFNVPKILIGATVVSIGTTLPETMVSVQAALQGNAGISYGNAIGSIICNASLIAAIALIACTNHIKRDSISLPTTIFFIAATVYVAIAYFTQTFTRADGIVLLAICAVYIVIAAKKAKDNIDDEQKEHPPVRRAVMFLIFGAALIAFGARLIVNNGTNIAQMLGVPDSVIGLTIVAIGTSLPEMTTTITSLVKGHNSLSLGNVIGANILNLTLVSGAAMTVSPFSLPPERLIGGVNASLVVDIPVMLAVMLILCLPALIKERTYKWQGVALLCIYAGFCIYQITY